MIQSAPISPSAAPNNVKMTSVIRTINIIRSLSSLSSLPNRIALVESNCCQYQSKRCAGHSKWQNIRHIKGAKDAQKATVIQQITRKIKIAIQVGGSGDPKFNTQLRAAIEEGKGKDVPNATIDNTIKKALLKKSVQVMLEARGPLNSCYLIEMNSDQIGTTRQDVAAAGKKIGIKLGDKGFATYAYTLRGIVYVPKVQDEKELTEESALDLAIEAGAEEVEEAEDEDETPVFQLLCDPDEIWQVKKAVEAMKFTVSDARLEYIPHTFAPLDPQQLENAAKFLDRIESFPDFVRVTTNIQDAAAEEEKMQQEKQ